MISVVRLCLALFLLLPGQLFAESRLALVIGNGAYTVAPELDNPTNDARDIAAALQELGFEVMLGTDLGQRDMLGLIEKFGERAATADAALFYFAGHAFQVDNHNYLVPTDVKLESIDKVVQTTVSLDAAVEALSRSNGIRLVFLDACRNNPLGIASRDLPEGLARVGSAADFLVTYATQPGAVAFDGDGRNGTFTEALLSHIRTPAEDIGEMMIGVRRDVIAATGGQQIPWESSSLTRQFEFAPGPPSASAETMLYQVAVRNNDPELMQLYLSQYPDGSHARDLVAILAGGGEKPVVRPGAEDDGEQLWALAQRTRQRELFQSYVELYPTGRHIDEAKMQAAALPAEEELGPGRRCERLATHPRDKTETTPGVPYSVLQDHAAEAIQVCTAATEAFPEQPRYVALLARAMAAAGLRDKAVDLYRQASDRGDLRAMVSLALLTESGDGVPKDPAAARALYEKAAALGSADAQINIAVDLLQNPKGDADVARGRELLQAASSTGSAIATFNLGVLAQDGTFGEPADALQLFRRAAREGEMQAYRAAAILLDEGRGVPRDPEGAAVQLLLGIASDDGATLDGFVAKPKDWSPDTIRAMQTRLAAAKLYEGSPDGVSGPKFLAALKAWREGGFDASVLGNTEG